VLVLTRRIGERLRIGPDVAIVVLDVRGREVRLGVTAPASVPIHREELYLRIQDANRAAALGQKDLAGAVARAARVLRTRDTSPSPSPCAPSSAP
jgi:carbon storage regulator